MSDFKAKMQGKRKGGRGGKRRVEEEREGKGETCHTNPSLLPAPLPVTAWHTTRSAVFAAERS